MNTLPESMNTLPESMNTLAESVNTLPECVNTLAESVNTLPECVNTLPECVNTLAEVAASSGIGDSLDWTSAFRLETPTSLSAPRPYSGSSPNPSGAWRQRVSRAVSTAKNGKSADSWSPRLDSTEGTAGKRPCVALQRCVAVVTNVRQPRAALRHDTWERGRLDGVLMIGILLLVRAGGTPAGPGGVRYRSCVYEPPRLGIDGLGAVRHEDDDIRHRLPERVRLCGENRRPSEGSCAPGGSNGRRLDMLVRRSLFLLLAAAVAVPIVAQDHPSDRTCVTGAATSMYVSGMHRANAPRLARALAASPPAGVEMRNGMFVVQKTPANSLLDHPNDLEGKSVVFAPAGADRYRAATVPLQYDTNVGTALRMFVNSGAPDWTYVRITLTAVKLPLFGQSVDTIYLTAFNSIALSPPGFTPATQYDRMEAAFVQGPTIAPLLMTSRRPATLNLPTVYKRESADGIVVTWRAGGALSYDVQAKIAKSGEITFSYRTLGEVTWGAVLITPGVGAFLPGLTTVAQLDDPADDVAAEAPESARAALDIRSVTLQQVTGMGGCLLTIGTGATPASMVPPLGDGIIVKVTFGDAPALTMTLLWNSEAIVTQPGRAMRDTATAGISGNQIQIAFTVDSLRPISTTTPGDRGHGPAPAIDRIEPARVQRRLCDGCGDGARR